MTLDELRRAFSPVHWFMLAIAVICLVVVTLQVAHGLGFRFDPFNSVERRAERAEAGAALAKSDAAARAVEVAGARDTSRLIETAATERAAVDQVVTRLETEARAAPDANLLLDSDRADRIHDGDRQLCARRPAACGPAAP